MKRKHVYEAAWCCQVALGEVLLQITALIALQCSKMLYNYHAQRRNGRLPAVSSCFQVGGDGVVRWIKHTKSPN
jgi:hypothetical protein